MPAPLYARYVPPKRSQKSNQPPAVPKLASQEVSPSPTPQLYARYVPPKASKGINEASKASETSSCGEIPRKSSVSEERTSKKRKRSQEPHIHQDRVGLIESPQQEPSRRQAHVQEVKYAKRKDKKEKNEKKDKHRQSSKADSAETSLQDESAAQGLSQSVPGQMNDADTILARYSVTGGAHRASVRQQQDPSGVQFGGGMDVDGEGGAEDRMDLDSLERVSQDDSEDEEMTQAGAEAILAKYRRSTQLAGAESGSRESKVRNSDRAADADEAELELHGLEPMPQPAQVPEAAYKPSFDALPSWLSNPTIISSTASLPFSDFNLSKKLLDNLQRKKYTDALAVQLGVLPLLLAGPHKYHGDLCVSAPTGSGKTLAYVLPMVENLKQKLVTKLRGIIIVPTRELVVQAREAAEICASGTGVKIGTAVGNVSLLAEQRLLVKRGQKYEPKAAKALDEEAKKRFQLGYGTDDIMLEGISSLLQDYVPDYSSSVDILICTPGRLVDHIRSSVGFSLRDVDWLVIDEADKLLDSSFQEWVEVLLGALHPILPLEELSARDRIMMNLRGSQPRRRVQKIILSATMTRDLSKLSSLKFERPTLVSIGNEITRNSRDNKSIADKEGESSSLAFELPSSLTEVAIKVGDGNDKPLYLLKLLQDEFSILPTEIVSDSEFTSGRLANHTGSSAHELTTPKNVLIFTNENENTTRLRHLLSILHPPLADTMETLTKSSATSDGRKTLNAFRSGRIKILIASDRVSRGLDVTDLAHVVNYDLPRSVTSYVHRVGRTARAGKEGKAWTLYTRSEGRWFWNSIAGGTEIQRNGNFVQRMKMDREIVISEDKKERYQDALEELQSAVKEGKS